MSGWFSIHRSPEMWALLEHHPSAFLLLTLIAGRASRDGNAIAGLGPNQAMIGDWKAAGLHSRQAYRHAQNVLKRNHLATFQGTTRGTIATLTDTTIYTIRKGDREPTEDTERNHSGTNEEPLSRKKEGKEEEKDSRRFAPPSVSEVSEFMATKGVNGSEGQSFVDFYESKNWMVGKNKMKKWKSAASGWISRKRERGELPKESARPKRNQEELRALFE